MLHLNLQLLLLLLLLWDEWGCQAVALERTTSHPSLLHQVAAGRALDIRLVVVVHRWVLRMVERLLLLLLWGRYHEVTLLGGYHLHVCGRGGMHVHHSSARDQLAALNSILRLLRGEIMSRRRHSMRRLYEHLRGIAGKPKRSQ